MDDDISRMLERSHARGERSSRRLIARVEAMHARLIARMDAHLARLGSLDPVEVIAEWELARRRRGGGPPQDTLH